MPDDPAPAAPKPLSFLRIPLSILVLASTGWQALRLSADFGRHITSGAAWITLAAALPFVVMSVVGAIALLRGDRPRSHWIWVAAVLSLFRWPVPDLPALGSTSHQQRLLNVVVAAVGARRVPLPTAVRTRGQGEFYFGLGRPQRWWQMVILLAGSWSRSSAIMLPLPL